MTGWAPPIRAKCIIWLLLIRSPKFSRDFGFLWFCSRTKRFYIHPNPNPNHKHNPEAIHNLIGLQPIKTRAEWDSSTVLK